MKELYDFIITYSIKALTEDNKWLEDISKHSTATIIATTKEIAIKQIQEDFSKEKDITAIIENVEQAPHEVYQLQQWANTHEPGEEMIYKKGYWDQLIFVRDRITELLCKNEKDYNKAYENYKTIRENIKVINTHISKSILLPVYYIKADNMSFILRYNFYDWKVSVISNNRIDCDFQGLFKDEKINKVYCEGFPEEFVFDEYENNNGCFTVELRSDYELFTFMFLIKNWINKNFK